MTTEYIAFKENQTAAVALEIVHMPATPRRFIPFM